MSKTLPRIAVDVAMLMTKVALRPVSGSETDSQPGSESGVNQREGRN